MLSCCSKSFAILPPNQCPSQSLLDHYDALFLSDFNGHVKEGLLKSAPQKTIPFDKIRFIAPEQTENLSYDDTIHLWIVVSSENPTEIIGWFDQASYASYEINRLRAELDTIDSALNSLSIRLEVSGAIDRSINLGSPYDHRPELMLVESFSQNSKEYHAKLSIVEERASKLVEQHGKYKELNLDMNSILHLSQDIIFVSDGKGKALRVSSSCKNMWGYEKDNFIGKSVYDLEKEGAFKPSATRMVLEAKEPIQITQRTKTGKNLMVISTPIKDEKGEIIRVINISKDITEISTLKKQLDKEKIRNESYRQKLNEIMGQNGSPSIIYSSEEMTNILMTAYKISEFDSTVLLLGESGVGKEVIANYIHRSSKRASKPFIKVNCGAIPENLLESELFGYEKGAFTGADKRGKAGLFEAANEGTIFLDEIGEIPFPLQVKLLRVLQEQEITRIGGTVPIKIDVRVITATNRNLAQEVQNNNFREDLYYRLNVVPIHIPALRERPKDIIPLIVHFTDRFNSKFIKNKHFSPRSIEQLCRYRWPGNVRELQNMIERIIITTDADYIEPHHLPEVFHSQNELTDNESRIGGDFPLEETISKTRRSQSGEWIAAIPIQLIRNYRKIGISHGEWGLFCTILTYIQNSQEQDLTEGILADHLQCSTRQIRKWIYSIKEKNLLQISRKRNASNKWNINHYNFAPLLDATLALKEKG